MKGLHCWQRVKAIWDRAGVVQYPHQLRAAARAINEMNGRVLLADEVGLGKTIEAGLIAYELMYRGLVNRVLILVPAGLVGQWVDELQCKFDLRFSVNPRGPAWLDHERIVASIDLAKRPEQLEVAAIRSYDLIIVDEAHRLKNAGTLVHRLVRRLQSRYLLLLTATPLQNNLEELYNLISLVRPDLADPEVGFRGQFGGEGAAAAAALRDTLAHVMIRHRRAEVLPWFPRRHVHLLRVDPSQEERVMYEAVTSLARSVYVSRGRQFVLPLITLQREVCSSPRAAAATLARLGLRDDIEIPLVTPASKVQTVVRMVARMEKPVVVFCEFRLTQDELATSLTAAGQDVATLHGGMTAGQRQRTLERFRAGRSVLVSTECGGLGLNLQCSHNLINCDLPWNPMRVEQRIGRVHRLGQTRDVNVFNLVLSGTIEDHIVSVLHDKIALFTRTVGELEVAVPRTDRRGLESRVLELYLTVDSDAFTGQLAELAAELAGDDREQTQLFDSIS